MSGSAAAESATTTLAPQRPPPDSEPAPLRESAKAVRLLFWGQIGGKVLRFLTDLILGRVLGPAGFGVVAASVSLTHILAEVGLLGTHRAVLRFASVEESQGRTRVAAALTRRALGLALVFGSALTGAVLLARRPLTIAFFGETASQWILPMFALAVPALGAASVIQFRARAGRRVLHDTLIGSIARTGFPFLVTAALFLAGWRLGGAAVGFTGGMIATLVLAVILLRRTDRALSPAAEPDGSPVGLRRLMTVAVPLALASASILLLNELDKVMLALFRAEEEVGIYNAAFRVSRQAVILLPALNAAISPWVAPLLAQGKQEDLNRLYRHTTRWSLAAGWSAALLFTMFSRDFLSLFGGAFVAGSMVLMLLSLGQIVNASVGNAGVILQFSGHERTELKNGLLVTIANIALNLALIPQYGATGAAVATVLSLALVAVRRLFQVRQVLGILPYDRKTGLVVLGGLVGAGVAFGARSAVAGLGGGAFVCAVAAVLGMVASWTALLMIIGVTEEEATLLRVPKRWIRRRSTCDRK